MFSAACISRMKTGADVLRQVERLLQSGQHEQAAASLDKHFPEDLPDNERPPRADLLRGWLLLARKDESGVLALFAAVERDPSLLGLAAQRVEDWLDGPGKAHDTMLLRHELTRMHALHQAAGRERAEVNGDEDYRAPADELAEAVEQALAPWRDDIRAAWLAERRCARAPRWRHLELLLELKPRQWHFRPDARDRLQRYCQRIEQAIPLCGGSIAVRAHPLATLPAHVRNMRKRAHPLFDTAGAEMFPSANNLNQSLKRPKNTRNDKKKSAILATLSSPLRRHRTLLASSAAATMLLLPMWVGWNMMTNHETRQRVASLEQRHTATLARKYWRREEAAGLFSPGKTVHAFLAALRARDNHPRLPLFTADSYRPGVGLRLAGDELHTLWSIWHGCGAFQTHVEGSRAVVRWPLTQSHCLPLLLRREQGRWRIAWTDMRNTLAINANGRWSFAHAGEQLPHAWLFAFPELFPVPDATSPDLKTSNAAAPTVQDTAGMRKTSRTRHIPAPTPLAQAVKPSMNTSQQGT